MCLELDAGKIDVLDGTSSAGPMLGKVLLSLVVIMALLNVLSLTAVHAHPNEKSTDYVLALHLVRAGKILPLQQVWRQIRTQQQGRLLDVALQKRRTGYVYELQLIDVQGVIWEVEVEAHNAQILEIHPYAEEEQDENIVD